MPIMFILNYKQFFIFFLFLGNIQNNDYVINKKEKEDFYFQSSDLYSILTEKLENISQYLNKT